jgi:SAM-dependent methyltransferase
MLNLNKSLALWEEIRLKSRSDLENLFKFPVSQPKYLDFHLSEEILNSKPIQSREIATKESFSESDLEKIAGREGSPSFKIIKSVLKLLFEANIIPELSGIGVELGSGIGLLSASLIDLDENKKIEGILALEAGFPFVETGIKLASEITLGVNSHKILPSYGSFDKIAVEKNAIDFIIQIEALHHADNLLPPMLEAYRVLKNGGYFISIDRSWPDGVKRQVLDELLDHHYSKEWLDAKGFPSNEPFSRRGNGEHEYTDAEWKFAFEKAGFKCKVIRHLHPKFHTKHFIKRLLSLFKLNKVVKIKIPSRTGIFRGALFGLVGFKSLYFGNVIKSEHPRPLTVSVYQKIESE